MKGDIDEKVIKKVDAEKEMERRERFGQKYKKFVRNSSTHQVVVVPNEDL